MNNNVCLKLLGIAIFQALLCSLCQSQSAEVNGRCVSASCKAAKETSVDRELKRLLRESGFTGRSNPLSSRGWAVVSILNWLTLVVYYGLMLPADCTATTRAAGATRLRTAWATHSPSRSAYKTMAW